MLPILFVLMSWLQESAANDDGPYWPQWRGPSDDGYASHASPPLSWSEEENIRWRVSPPGKGHSTPIVWGDRIFITTAVPVGEALPPRMSGAPGAHDNSPITHRHEFWVLCLARKDGQVLWQKTLHEALPHEGGHVSASLASASPVTDGERVYVSFGSYGVYALGFDGELKWDVALGKMASKHGHGEGSSPVLYGDSLVINWDHEGDSFIIALDKATGETRWKKDRDEVTSWATPIVIVHEGKPQVIVSGSQRLRSYALEDGSVLWECGGLSRNVVSSPVFSDGVVYAGSSYEKQSMLAIRVDGATGDLTRNTDHVLWRRARRTPYVPSPAVHGPWIYVLHHYQGVLSRIDKVSGREPQGPFRLKGIGNVYASPVATDQALFITDREGNTLVLSHDETPQMLSYNSLNDSVNASLALVDREIYVRGERFLYCIASKE